ncbi:MAG: patatin-like phospholipase family protein [Nostoc sp. JL34]|uniref:patatin-like phospholipase family protein n=1 Tax=Nostoc sp. JL34 TaxID=2815397 RepID=UPI001D815481|nr:patatin-like phospholipase family protein [Nostoc sp. JL34]MBN3883225.1 patatin-like phospholipase family protein [Nostoc sp. JL34]
MKKFIWLLPVLAVIATWLPRSDAVWKYLFFLRLPILMGLFLLLLPKLAKDWLPAMLKNLFVLRTRWQLAVVIVSAIGAGTSVISVAAIILDNAAARFGVPSTIEISEFWQYGIAIALSLYICIIAFDLSKEKLNNNERQWGAFVGAILSIGLLFFVSFIRQWLSSNAFLKKILTDIVAFVSKHNTSGYINPQTGELSAGHLTAIAYFIIGVVIYVTVGLLFNPKSETNRPEAPALLYVLLITSMVTLVYGGATFYFDYFRIPVLIIFIVFSALSYVAFDVNHFFPVNKFKDSEDKKRGDSDSTNFPEVLEKRLQHQKGERTLVIICASGGGIQAAGWTVQVLSGLQELLGESFTKAIGLISAVSGGSVGTMYYLDRFNKDGFLEESEQEKYDKTNSFYAATRDSLDAVGWGLVYLDLWRFIGFPFLVNPKFDRGTAVETDWQGEMKEPKNIKTFGTWRKQIFDGEIPIPVFNATLVENGWRFLITPVTFSKAPEKKFTDFNTLYEAYDMNVVTAARLSATFPYVSPICRSSVNIPNQNYHVADGGYFDNSGFVTAAEWLDEQLNEWSKTENSLNVKRVLILQINPFPKSASTENVQGNGGWFMATIGPLLAMFKVRDPVLASRNAKEADLLAKKWENKVDIQYFPIFFPSESEIPPEFAVSEFYKDGRYRLPLSWKLTDREKQAIQDGWAAITTGKNIQKIKQLWHKTWSMPDSTDRN